jgi:hypothetical protein
MTRRGLIIGTSHSAALRLAWAKWADDWPAMRLDFAALHGHVSDFVVQDGCLTAASPEARATLSRISGANAFPLQDYDFVALCSGSPSCYHAIKLYNTARWPGLPSQRRPPKRGNQAMALVSSACFAAALTAAMRQAQALTLLAEIAATCPAQRFIIPEPPLSFDALAEKRRFKGFADLHQNGDAATLGQMQGDCAERACAGLGARIQLPPPVLAHAFFAHPDMRRGAKRLGTQDTLDQPTDDYLHGNDIFGRHMLTALHATLQPPANP